MNSQLGETTLNKQKIKKPGLSALQSDHKLSRSPQPESSPHHTYHRTSDGTRKHRECIRHRKVARTEAQTWHLRDKWQNQAWTAGEHWRLLHKQSICSIRVAPQWRWLAKPSAPSFLANFHITELTERWALKPTSASEDRGLRLFTLKIKTNPKSCLYTEVSEVHPEGKASPWTPWRAALPLSLWANSTWTLGMQH